MDPPNFKKYGVPFYSVGWIPYKSVLASLQQESKFDGEDEEKSEPEKNLTDERHYVAFSGGGGEGRSGIPNAIVLSCFDSAANTLSDQPVAKLGTGSDLPYRMAVHPGGGGIICSMPNSCRWFEWEAKESSEPHKFGIKTSEKSFTQLEDVGQQLAISFNQDGSIIAVGGQDGNLKVFKWPSMEVIINETNAHSTVKDLDFSPDSKYLISLGSGGPGRVWDLTSSAVTASLSKENDERFSFCKFSRISDQNSLLYIAAVTGKGHGSILTWNTDTWKRVASRTIVRDPISALTISADGKFLACGTSEGDIIIINSAKMQIHTSIKKSHLGIVTALAFSPDSRALASVSMDSSARITLVEEKKKNGGMSLWIIVFIILLAMAAYFLKLEGFVKQIGGPITN